MTCTPEGTCRDVLVSPTFQPVDEVRCINDRGDVSAGSNIRCTSLDRPAVAELLTECLPGCVRVRTTSPAVRGF